ncbi:hypothetical protein, partial [Rhizobium ruizarguesonis]|uniref:hypothetical protein n=1 Tax=Rhizobium ruizarguesonis TaxID=2081791 RepID=UPI002ACC11FE
DLLQPVRRKIHRPMQIIGPGMHTSMTAHQNAAMDFAPRTVAASKCGLQRGSIGLLVSPTTGDAADG